MDSMFKMIIVNMMYLAHELKGNVNSARKGGMDAHSC